MKDLAHRALSPAVTAVIAVIATLPGCLSTDDLADHSCPPGGTKLTYLNFGQDFMARYCVRCHGGPNGYSSRALNTQGAVQANLQRVFVNAAGQNRAMPPGPDDPSQAERDQLAEWLACGAP